MEAIMSAKMTTNREEIIADICEGSVDNFCNLLEQYKIQDVVPMIDQAIDDLADEIMEADDEK
jgi:hypothetical protein